VELFAGPGGTAQDPVDPDGRGSSKRLAYAGRMHRRSVLLVLQALVFADVTRPQCLLLGANRL
jgi:hypothetical protein